MMIIFPHGLLLPTHVAEKARHEKRVNKRQRMFKVWEHFTLPKGITLNSLTVM